LSYSVFFLSKRKNRFENQLYYRSQLEKIHLIATNFNLDGRKTRSLLRHSNTYAVEAIKCFCQTCIAPIRHEWSALGTFTTFKSVSLQTFLLKSPKYWSVVHDFSDCSQSQCVITRNYVLFVHDARFLSFLYLRAAVTRTKYVRHTFDVLTVFYLQQMYSDAFWSPDSVYCSNNSWPIPTEHVTTRLNVPCSSYGFSTFPRCPTRAALTLTTWTETRLAHVRNPICFDRRTFSPKPLVGT
jgi:hypothetical protein